MYAEELKQLPLFETCNEADLVRLLRRPHRRQEYGAGSRVLRLGDPCLSLMALTEGTVETRMGSDEGREVVVERIDAPRLLGPIFLYAEDNAMPVEVSAVTDAVVWFINREAFSDFMREHPHVMQAFMQVISAQGRFLSDKVRSFATKGLQSRVIEYLETRGAITSVAAAAEMLGVTRPSLSRVLAEMQAAGLIVRTDRGFVKR